MLVVDRCGHHGLSPLWCDVDVVEKRSVPTATR
jgi:hypothetical protein